MNEDLKIICPFCNAPYTAEMLMELWDEGIGCPSCYSAHPKGKLEIKCTKCKKTVYIKEYDYFDT